MLTRTSSKALLPVLSKDEEDEPGITMPGMTVQEDGVRSLYGALEQAKTSSKESDFDARWTELLDRITENPEKEYGVLRERHFQTRSFFSRQCHRHQYLNPQAGPFNCNRFNLKKLFLAYADNQEVTTREVNETLGVGNHSGLVAVLFRELQSIKFIKSQKSRTGPERRFL